MWQAVYAALHDAGGELAGAIADMDIFDNVLSRAHVQRYARHIEAAPMAPAPSMIEILGCSRVARLTRALSHQMANGTGGHGREPASRHHAGDRRDLCIGWRAPVVRADLNTEVDPSLAGASSSAGHEVALAKPTRAERDGCRGSANKSDDCWSYI